MAEKLYFFLASPAQQLEEGDGGVPPEYNDFLIMREMGWDYWTFQSQPNFFIEQVRAFLFAENKASAKMKGGRMQDE